MATTSVTQTDTQFINFNSFMDVDIFIRNSNLNDINYSNGLMRLNRFVGVMDVKKLMKQFPHCFHNNELEDYGNDFMAWNIFKINCPEFRIGMEMREVDSIPRYYFKNWEHDDLEVSYIESADMKIRHYFFEWMESAIFTKTYQRSYFDDVKSDWFIIYPLNFQGQAERYEIFQDLVPISINSVNYDVSDDGSQTVLTTVKFKYTHHRLLSLTNDKKSSFKSQQKFNIPPEDAKK